MKLNPVNLMKQKVTEEHVLEAINSCYNDRCFSTFPYITYKLTSSEKALYQYNSGNCIALSLYVKKYLEANHRIKSHIITASVPKRYQIEGQPHICHVSLLIPITETSFYIIDCPFYFLKPLYCDLVNNELRQIESMNIHENTRDIIKYKLNNAPHQKHVLPNSVECVCYFETDPNDTWSYYTNEPVDPDEEIGKFFMQIKPQPFLCKTKTDKKGNIIKIYHIKIDDDSNFIFIENRVEKYKGPIDKIPKRIEKILKTKLFSFLNNFIV
jgi:hypothetical protein